MMCLAFIPPLGFFLPCDFCTWWPLRASRLRESWSVQIDLQVCSIKQDKLYTSKLYRQHRFAFLSLNSSSSSLFQLV